MHFTLENLGWLNQARLLLLPTLNNLNKFPYFSKMVLKSWCSFLINCLHRAHEGYLDQGIMVKDSKLLRKNYFQTRQLKIDLLSIFPTDFAYLLFDNTCHEVMTFYITNTIIHKATKHIIFSDYALPCHH